MTKLQNFFHSICARILPTGCIVCGVFQDQQICIDCIKLLAHEQLSNYECCRRCANLLNPSEVINHECLECTQNPPYFDESYCLDRYEGRLQKSLLELKFQRRLFHASGLAFAWNALSPAGDQGNIEGYLLPVPLSQGKLWARGFNQSWEIARKIHCSKFLQKNPHILKRHRHSHQQASETRINRQRMIQGQFYINPVYQKLLEDQTVVVFDDVMTSGATLNEIARILKDNGVSRVINWVLLRTLIQDSERHLKS